MYVIIYLENSFQMSYSNWKVWKILSHNFFLYAFEVQIFTIFFKIIKICKQFWIQNRASTTSSFSRRPITDLCQFTHFVIFDLVLATLVLFRWIFFRYFCGDFPRGYISVWAYKVHLTRPACLGFRFSKLKFILFFIHSLDIVLNIIYVTPNKLYNNIHS
jgi:hypothetical protein